MIRAFIRVGGAVFQGVRRIAWALGMPRRAGVHAVAVTPEGRVVLVRLTYAPGWRLPGGGRGAREAAAEAVMRELREEIGLTTSDPPRAVAETRDEGGLFVVTGVAYAPRRSLEIEKVEAFDPAHLPEAATPRTRRVVAELLARGLLSCGSSSAPAAGPGGHPPGR
jgi:8-oxo-dGTP pyrophosphatase MutT (NUDIX family)